MICAIAATSDCAIADAHGALGGFGTETGREAWNLAYAAKAYAEGHIDAERCEDTPSFDMYAESCAEAEALLRCGWSPEDGGTP